MDMLIVERKDGTRYDLEKLDIHVLKFYPSSPEPDTEKRTIPGMDGHIDLGTTYAGRKLHAEISIMPQDYLEYSLLRNEVFRIFDSRESFYIIHHSEPRKRWLVKYSSPFSIPHEQPKLGSFDIEFESSSAYSQSIGSLLDPFTFDVEMWQFGMNIPLVDFSYTHHNTRNFSIWNLGDKVVDPRHDMLQIFYKGASNALTIKNHTTGDTWHHKKTTQMTDTVTLDGVFSRKNGVSIFGDTNRKLISLAPGENKFTLTNTNGPFEIAFDFRFLYL